MNWLTKVALVVLLGLFLATAAAFACTNPPGPSSFSIVGDATRPLWPGGSAPIDLVFTNPSRQAITVTDVTAWVAGTNDARRCPAAVNFAIAQQLRKAVVVPARSTRSLLDLGVPQSEWPVVRMLDRLTSQDGCAGKSVLLAYAGSAR